MPEDAPRRFQDTRWTIVRAARSARPTEARQALASLCETYWYPVYAFIRRRASSDDEARDLTQAFFMRVIEKDAFRQARQDRGRFRTFLLSSVCHFLANERETAGAQKRGGDKVHLALECDDGERRYAREPVTDETPERTYERKWALEVIGTAVKEVEAQYRRGGRAELFAALRPFVTGDEPPSHEQLAQDLDTTAGAIRVAVHRLRRQFAAALRATVADTVERAEEVDDELRYLLEAVGP